MKVVELTENQEFNGDTGICLQKVVDFFYKVYCTSLSVFSHSLLYCQNDEQSIYTQVAEQACLGVEANDLLVFRPDATKYFTHSIFLTGRGGVHHETAAHHAAGCGSGRGHAGDGREGRPAAARRRDGGHPPPGTCH